MGAVARERVVVPRTVPVARLLLLLVAVGLVGAVTAGVGWNLLRSTGSATSAGSAASGDPPRGPVAATETQRAKSVGEVVIKQGAQLEAELAAALSRIGQARSDAFEMVSQHRLGLADESGSPAERADRGLLDRLRTNGYRLEDLKYRIGRVEVLRVKGRTVDVAAVVSVTAHRQVRVGGDYAAGVPAGRSAVLVFTLRAVGEATAGAGRWRVHDIRSQA